MAKRRDFINELAKLDEEINKLQKEREAALEELRLYEQSYSQAERRLNSLKQLKNALVKSVRTLGAYLLGRRNLKHLYSKSFKIKHAINQLKPYKYYLYNLGFFEATLSQLKEMLLTTKDKYLYRAILWELGLWYANEQSPFGAKKSLTYLYEFLIKESDPTLLRQGTILLVEDLTMLGFKQEAKDIIAALLKEDPHPDLYFAMANVHENIDERLRWMNKVFHHYGLAEITFDSEGKDPTYEDLRTKLTEQKNVTGPKVSVLLPAYNAEVGIQIAIESILNQTYENIELLIIDDHSSDGTLNVIKDYAEKDSRIKWFQTPKNSGPYVARNIGLKHATGKYVTVNDADDWSHAEKIERQVKHLEENEQIIANTSEHARLTEQLTLHRRGTPGTYIFSNMSSLMFRREIVMEKLGYWDSVRFAADGEFKRRLINAFGADRIVDLKTGPLSLPRQSVSSLTASSAFGYSGFFMGVRKEYVASFSKYHNESTNLYYPFPMEDRPYPVPEPMWVEREEKVNGFRHFDVVIAADFAENTPLQREVIKEINVHKKIGIRTGLLFKSCYNMVRPKEFNDTIRKEINGRDVQALVYGENVTCDVLIIHGHLTLEERQHYLPNIKPAMVVVILDEQLRDVRKISREVINKYGKRGIWFAFNEKTLNKIAAENLHDVRYIDLASTPWSVSAEQYEQRLADWLTDI